MSTSKGISLILVLIGALSTSLFGQGVTTSELSGFVTDTDGNALEGANVIATHEPSSTTYGTTVREGGAYNIPNMRVGGPYSVTATHIGYATQKEENITMNLGSVSKVNFQLVQEALEMAAIDVVAEMDDVLNSDRTGAATYVDQDLVMVLPSIKRSTRDLTRLDPRSDGNFSFGGRNWLYNNISLDGSYFNNPFGLDDPAPGGQTNAEPVPYEAVEQVQISIAPFDVREGGFTGAGINTVTKSGTNEFNGSVYSYIRNESLIGNKVSGEEVLASPSLSFNQSGVSIGGPILPGKLFFFANFETVNRDDPGTNYVADSDGNVVFGESRVSATQMDLISARLKDVYGYDTGPYQGYTHTTKNTKTLLKLNWNISDKHNLMFRYNKLDASRDLPPHGFVLSYNNTGRGPNSTSLPFKNSGYQINNILDSYAFEMNSMLGNKIANRFFVSKNEFRDYRVPFSVDFPTVEIGEAGVTYTTAGHEPFSIHNILDQDVLQVTNNLTYYMGKHAITAGFNYENFKFFNSFNIFRHGVFFLDASWALFLGGTTFSTIDAFMAATSPDSASQAGFSDMVGTGPYKGEKIDVAQMSYYVQDEFSVNPNLNVTAGVRIDIPQYNNSPEPNTFASGLTLLDENDKSETVDQAAMPSADPIMSPRVGFNYANDDRSLQVRGGFGLFTGRLPFVWVGNIFSNPGDNPSLYEPGGSIAVDDIPSDHVTDDGSGRVGYEGLQSVLQQSYDVNSMATDFKWPQVQTLNLAVDKLFPGGMLATVELVHSSDKNAIYMRNADLAKPTRQLNDGRDYFSADSVHSSDGPAGSHELNSYWPGSGEGVYVIDNIDEGSNLTLTAQLRGQLAGVNWSAAYTYLDAKNNLQSTEIASVLYSSQPVQGDPNKPGLAPSQFGMKHRIIGTATYGINWGGNMSTSLGLFFEAGQGNRYIYSGGNRYSHVYSGDVNGDGFGGNDLVYIPKDANDINLTDASEWDALNKFIEQDPYLSDNRGKIAERNGLLNPWFTNLDLKLLHDIGLNLGGKRRSIQISLDILNVANLINSNWGVRKIANASATSPLTLDSWNSEGEPVFSFNGATETFTDDLSEFSRWRMQMGVKLAF